MMAGTTQLNSNSYNSYNSNIIVIIISFDFFAVTFVVIDYNNYMVAFDYDNLYHQL